MWPLLVEFCNAQSDYCSFANLEFKFLLGEIMAELGYAKHVIMSY